jgi:hypothetical protein
MRFQCWVSIITDMHSVLLLTAFVTQQLLRELASMLRLYVHCISCSCISFYNSSGTTENSILYTTYAAKPIARMPGLCTYSRRRC